MKLQVGASFIIWAICFIWLGIVEATKDCPFGKRKITTTHARVKRVIGGSEAIANSWPWMVNFIDNKNRQQCAGSIIDREWILTAAHCFLFSASPGPLNNDYTFHVADHNLNITDPQEYEVEAMKVYIHPEYVIGGWLSPGDYDIALIKLSKPLNYTDYVQPICLGKKEDIFSENDTCVLIGWGNNKDTARYHRSPFLKEVELDLVSLEECNSNTSYKGTVSDRFLCAGRKEGGIDGCYGDSGGPYQCKRNNTWIQLGIMIWGIGCAQPNHYGVYTDVRVLQSFIELVQAGPNSKLTSYYNETLEEVQPDAGRRPLSNLHDLLTNKSEFSDIDLVRNFQLLPYQIKLLNTTTLNDLIFVSSRENLTANTTKLAYITEHLVRQVERLYVYYKSKEVSKEFNMTFEEIYKSANLTRDEFLSSEFSVIENIRKQMYIKRYINNLQMYRDTLITYRPGLNITFNIAQIEKDLNRPADNLKNLDKKSLKQILVKHNQQLFTEMLSIRNISSFFEISLEQLKNMTVSNVLSEYLNIRLTTFASLHKLTDREIDVVKVKKISTVPYSDDQSLYGLVMKMLEAHGSSFACGVRNENSRSRRKRVIGGREASKNSWPWIVNFIDSNTNEQYCAGTIISRKWIVTAGHCFVLSESVLQLSAYTYHVGDHRLNFTDPHEYTIKPSKIFIHPQYIRGTSNHPGNNDIALIELAKPLTYSENVRPVCLVEDKNSFVNDSCYVTGWGNNVNREGYHRSPVLKEAKVDFVALDECNSNTSYNGIIPDTFLCAGFKEGGTDGCYGDSGGPLQCDRNGSWVQIGIVSWGKGCAQPNYYGVYSDVQSLLPFINAIRSGPNMNLTTYYQRTLEEVIPKMQERPSKNLHALLTNNQLFSAVDIVRNLQVFPYQVKLLNKTTLNNLIFVSDKNNLIANNTMLIYIAQIFLNQTSRLRMYMKSLELAKELNISFDEILQLSNLPKQTLLDSKSEILEQVKIKAININKLVDKLKQFKTSLMTYRNNLQISLDVVKIREDFNRRSLETINGTTDRELKQYLVGENNMIFTKTLTIRNISTFFNVSSENLKNMTVTQMLTQVLGISLENYMTLHMFTTDQLESIKDVKISTVPSPDDKSLYEITNAILQLRTVKKCSESSCSRNAECIQHSNYSISCRCKKGYVGNGINCDTGNTIFSSQLVLNQTFTESLNNPNSAEYRNLAETIQNVLTTAIRKENNSPGFLGCQVTGFLNGSVIAQYVLIFQLQKSQSVNVSELLQVVAAAVQNGSLGIPVVSTRPIKTTDFCSLGFHNCHMHATCRIKDGIATCTCKDNYYGDGESCVDSCTNHQCPVHSYCFRGLNGQAKCICDPGYTKKEKGCEKADDEDFKTALIIVSCVAGTLLLLTLMVCWYQYCNRNRKSAKMTSTTVANKNANENPAFDTVDLDNL